LGNSAGSGRDARWTAAGTAALQPENEFSLCDRAHIQGMGFTEKIDRLIDA